MHIRDHASLSQGLMWGSRVPITTELSWNNFLLSVCLKSPPLSPHPHSDTPRLFHGVVRTIRTPLPRPPLKGDRDVKAPPRPQQVAEVAGYSLAYSREGWSPGASHQASRGPPGARLAGLQVSHAGFEWET